MTILSALRRAPQSWRSAVLGGVAATTLGVVTVVVGAQLIGVAPPNCHASPYCDQTYHCIQPLGDPLIPYGAHPLVQHKTGASKP